jgi:CRP/FNR family transcriptional regulator, cyclic AMP receptor protein
MLENSALLDEINNMLMDCSLFDHFTPAEIRSAVRYFGISKIAAGDIIFREGDAGTFMCIVNDGNISVLKSREDEETVKMATLHSGKTFGEMAVLDGEWRSATCVAETDCILLTLSKESLDRMLAEVPRTAAAVIRVVAVSLSRRLRIADGKLVDHQI